MLLKLYFINKLITTALIVQIKTFKMTVLITNYKQKTRLF